MTVGKFPLLIAGTVVSFNTILMKNTSFKILILSGLFALAISCGTKKPVIAKTPEIITAAPEIKKINNPLEVDFDSETEKNG